STNLAVGSLRGFTCAICLLHSDFCILTSAISLMQSAILDALALAADQHAWHMLRGLPRFAEGGIRSVPASVVGVVSRRTSFAVIALSASRTMQHDLVRSG